MDGGISSTVTRVQSQLLPYRDNGFNFPPLDFSQQPWPTRTRLAYEGKAYELCLLRHLIRFHTDHLL